jgi:hypothetical protein
MPSPRLRSALLLLALLVPATPAVAHPSWSLAHDPARRIVYYSDLERVWQIDGAGRRSVAVPDVHTHELRIDTAGNLYGEDLQGTGNGWRNRVWKRTPDGRLTDVIPWRSGIRDDYGFVADTSGTLYWPSCPGREAPCVIKQRRGEAVSVAAAGARFPGPLNYLADDGRGGVLVADGPDLKRITPAGVVEPVAAGLSRTPGRYGLMGLQAVADGSVYAAAFEDRLILRLTPDGTRTVVARSEPPWQPAAVLKAPDGLWVLEFDRANVRVRHLRTDGSVKAYGPGR